MTDPSGPPGEFRSLHSGRLVVPGWTNLIPGLPDAVEVQFDLDPRDLARESACLLVEYWATPEELTLQGVLPVRAFNAVPEGWCVFVPARGRVLVRALDPQPTPPVLVSHWLNIDPRTPEGTVVTVAVSLPAPPSPWQSLLNG